MIFSVIVIVKSYVEHMMQVYVYRNYAFSILDI